MRTTGRARGVTRATTACRRRKRVVPRDAGRRGQRVLSRLSGRYEVSGACGEGWKRRIFVGHIDDGETAEDLLRLDERTVGEQGRAARCIDTEYRGDVVQAASENKDPDSLHLGHQRPQSLGLLT